MRVFVIFIGDFDDDHAVGHLAAIQTEQGVETGHFETFENAGNFHDMDYGGENDDPHNCLEVVMAKFPPSEGIAGMF